MLLSQNNVLRTIFYFLKGICMSPYIYNMLPPSSCFLACHLKLSVNSKPLLASENLFYLLPYLFHRLREWISNLRHVVFHSFMWFLYFLVLCMNGLATCSSLTWSIATFSSSCKWTCQLISFRTILVSLLHNPKCRFISSHTFCIGKYWYLKSWISWQ